MTRPTEERPSACFTEGGSLDGFLGLPLKDMVQVEKDSLGLGRSPLPTRNENLKRGRPWGNTKYNEGEAPFSLSLTLTLSRRHRHPLGVAHK